MSRFGLRSHIDETHNKQYEDDTTTTAAAIKTIKNKHKRVYQKKKKKLTLAQEEEEQQKQNVNSDNIELATTSSTTKISLMCSLPLTRLSGFIEKLQLNKQAKNQATKYLLQQQQTTLAKNILFDSLKTTTTVINKSEQQQQTDIEEKIYADEKGKEMEKMENEEDLIQIEEEEEDNNKYKKQQQNTQNFIIDKLMCMYCDKLFTTVKMQMKHIEKFHMLPQQQQQQQRTDRRSSVRNSTNNQQQQQKHANCNYCKKSTTIAVVDDLLNEINLNALFMHLIECHADKYFACKKCMLRFANKQKLQKHMKMLHATNTTTTTLLPYQIQQQQCATDNNENSITTPILTTKRSLRLLQQQTSLDNSNSTDTCTSSQLLSNEEPTILSRLGLAQNRLPTKRKSGMRLRREATTTTTNTTANILPDKLRSGRSSTIHPLLTTTTTSNTLIGGRNSSQSTTTSVNTESPTREVLFRMPARNESINSFVIDDDFYKEVINNVRYNLLYFLDGKLNNATTITTTRTLTTNSSINSIAPQTLMVRSTLAHSPLVDDMEGNKELHAASLLSAVTAFPTLLTAEQYGGDAAKLRRAHTKHSWKWKWDSAKKFKLINEGGKMVKKMKPLMGLRDLSKLDMWTQLSMRHKFEQQQNQQTVSRNKLRIEKLRLNAQLNLILDKRLLPQISLEQNEQTIIKLEKVEQEQRVNRVLDMHQSELGFNVPQNLLSVLQLRSKTQLSNATQPRLILSGEWARPRCYMCMLCGAKFDKLKSLEEHKMFRHSHIYCTHYEVVGRELLANDLLQHLFLPKQALARYNAQLPGSCEASLLTLVEDESSDSLQSSTTMTTTTTPAPVTQIVSPTYSLQSCSSSRQGLSPVTTPTTPTVLRTPCKIFHHNNNNHNNTNTTNSDVVTMRVCSKCQRKCSGAMDLYRHMLDCSGDYIWSMVKKRKYRYYCGSKKRRRGELRKTPKQQQPQQQPPKTPDISIQKSPTSNNNQPTPRQRPSDGKKKRTFFSIKKKS